MTTLSPSKKNISLCKFGALKTYFLLWITNVFVFITWENMLWALFEGAIRMEKKKWKVMIILYVYFVQNETTTTNEKKNESRLAKSKHNYLSF
jgi:hypothetical protein